ncbi:VOC family protein [Nocardiopsis listeri]|uniref:VOC family protein n=1 Tax=Nocardiopsis listeri TaxID=53440 RepID=UPI0008333EAC|nr:VOC family protein [Nocardiopsis listeri]
MAGKFTELAIDCAEPEALARFWCAVLDYEVLAVEDEGAFVAIGPATAAEDENRVGPVPPALTFARVPEGKSAKNRLHIDVNPTDREQADEVRRLVDLGARRTDGGRSEFSWVIMTDPEGNEFCVLSTRLP